VLILRDVEGEQDQIDQPPNPAPAQRQELADGEPVMSEVEAIRAEEPEEVGKQERGCARLVRVLAGRWWWRLLLVVPRLRGRVAGLRLPAGRRRRVTGWGSETHELLAGAPRLGEVRRGYWPLSALVMPIFAS